MRKLLICMSVVLALLATGGAAMAQDPICGTLSAADCEIITQAAAAQADVTSATFTFTLDVTSGAQTIPVTGDGSFSVDRAALASLEDLDPSALSADPAAAFAVAGDAVKAVDASLNINLMGLPVNMLLVDGVGYLNFETLAPMLGGANSGLPQGWAGLDLAGAFEMMGPMMSGMMGQMGDMGSMGATTDQLDPAQQEALQKAVAQYATIARVDDEAGQAVFVTTIDFAGLFSDPVFMSMVMDQMAASGQEMTEDMMDEMNEAIAAISGGVNISLTQKIDLSTNYTTGVGFDLDLDGQTLAAAGAGEMEDFSIAAMFSFDDFNAAPALSAPAGAPVSTIMDLLSGMGGMGGF